MEYVKVLIIGAGPAGFAAAKAAAQSGARPILAGAEPLPPYWRPRLNEVLAAGAPAEKLLMQKEEWFAANGIRFLSSRRAAAIDSAAHMVLWEDGAQTEYGTLVLATGALANLPPIPHAASIYPIRSYADAQRARAAGLAAGRVFIAGGGVLGLETALALRQAGCHVVVAELAGTLLPRQLDPEGGRFFQKLLEDAGLQILTAADFKALRDVIEGACVIAAAGVHPDLALAKTAGLHTARGILVDDRMRTSEPSVFACGDVAEYQSNVPGLMLTASAQGSVAGTNAAGGDAVYHAAPPSPMLRAAGITVLSVGNVCNCPGAAIFRRIQNGSYAAAVVDGGKLVGAAFIGDTKLGNLFRQHIERGTEVPHTDTFAAVLRCIGCE